MKGLYALKPWYAARLGRLTTLAVARRVSPDVFTAAGVLAAAFAAAAIAAGWWLPAALGLAARLAGANLDGAVARARRVSRPWGFVLNELGDRASDLLLFAGLAGLALTHPVRVALPGVQSNGAGAVLLVLIAALAATLPTFTALTAAGAGGTRANGGPVGKTERCALAVLATAVPALLPVLCLAIVGGSVLTAALRLRRTHAELTAASPS